jgi:hypothetical protein
MSNFLHTKIGHQPAGALVEVDLTSRANVLLVDSTNLQRYRSGQDFRYLGGEARQSLVRLQVPYAGTWHVVVDLGGGSGRVGANVRVLPRAA